VFQISDGESFLQLFGGEPLAQVLAESDDTVGTVAIVPVKVIRDETIHTLRNAKAGPGLQNLAPLRVVQARPIFAHPSDVVSLARDRLSEFVLLQQVKRVGNRLWSEQLFIPLIAIESKESARPLRAFRIAHQELYIHMADHFHASAMQLGVEAARTTLGTRWWPRTGRCAG
jgi:hypothetical protein